MSKYKEIYWCFGWWQRTVSMKCGAINLTSQYTRIAMKNVISCILKNILFIDNSTVNNNNETIVPKFVVEDGFSTK